MALDFGARLLCAALLATVVCQPSFAVDWVLHSGEVHTPGGFVQAIGVSEGVITHLGDAADARRWVTEGTRVVDLGGRTVLPGIHDVHVHPLFAGLEQFQCRFAPGADAAVIVAAVRGCIADAEPGAWVQGGNWVGAVFAPGEQTAALLDTVAPDNPVALIDESLHTLWVNSRALALAGITADTRDPEGGVIDRDERGEPTGVLRESAVALVETLIPPPTAPMIRKALVDATQEMLSLGITSFTVASVRHAEIGHWADLSAEGEIRQRVRGCIVWRSLRDPDRADLIVQRARYARPRFRLDCVKMFLDGVPTESRTAAMLEPYAGSTEERGLLMVPWDELRAAVVDYDRQSLHIKFHAAGDAAVRAAIDAVAAAREANGNRGPRHDVGHNSFVHTDDIPRARDLGMAWEFSPYIWYPTPIASVDIRRAVGGARLARFIPIRDAAESGALVTVGSDWSVVPSASPWLALETMVTRRVPGGGPETLAGGQRVSREIAFEILTANGARLMGQRDAVGAIELGMRADLVVTGTNPLTVPIEQVHRTEVALTLIDGEVVFNRPGDGLLDRASR